MYTEPYRPCTMCRTQLRRMDPAKAQKSFASFFNIRVRFGEVKTNWEGYECPNCGSEEWINPFARVREGK